MEVRLELKICENCGCLWFRTLTQQNVYCRECETKLKTFPAPETRKRRGRKGRKPVMKIWAAEEDTALGGAKRESWVADLEPWVLDYDRQFVLGGAGATGGAE